MLLGRYLAPLPIRSRGCFQLVSAVRADTRERCVVVLPGPAGDADRVEAAFAEIERVHALLDSPLIPAVAARGVADGMPFLELACDGLFDAHELVRLLADAGRRLPYGGADAFIASLRAAMEVGHRTLDPLTGEPICMGRISLGNVLFNERGEWFLVGFGHNFPVAKDDGSVDGNTTFFQAPELAAGGEPSPSGDYVALVLMMRSVLGYVDLNETAIGRILRGDVRPTDAELIEALRWVDKHMLGQVAKARPSVREAVAVADRVRELASVVLDPDGFRAIVSELNRERDEGRPEPEGPGHPPAEVVLGPRATWIEAPSGERQKLGRALSRMVLALVERLRQGDAPLTTAELLEAGWPGEQPIFEAGQNRVYVSVNRLRGVGLREVLERSGDGYRLVPGTIVRIEGEPLGATPGATPDPASRRRRQRVSRA